MKILLKCLLPLSLVAMAQAEIVVQEDAAVLYAHPQLRSLVFENEQARQMVVFPATPIFIAPPPLLMRAPGSMPAYPPAMPYGGINQPARPGNQNNSIYLLQRAHGFSQDLYRRDVPVYFWNAPLGYQWLSYGTPYPPAMAPGFNQPARPSNRDNNLYLLNRAHDFSMDRYRKP